MKASNYQKSQKLVERYLSLLNRVSNKGNSSTDIAELHSICRDFALLLSQMNCDYSNSMIRRRKATHERTRKELFNPNVK